MNRTLLMSGLCAGAIIAGTTVGVTAMMTSDNSSNAAATTTTSTAISASTTTSMSMPSGMPTSMSNGMPGDMSGGMSGDEKMGNGDVVRQVTLNTMPTGWVSFGQDSSGRLQATVQVDGLTPGSAHTVEFDAGANPVPVTVLDTLTANSLGQASATLSSMDTDPLPAGADFAIRLGRHGGDNNQNPLAGEIIARTDPLPRDPSGHKFTLHAVDNTTTGASAGSRAGHATLTYDPTAQTVTVKLTASGLTPGGHALHIHVGSCQAQGAPKYMPMNDFVADPHGDINDTRVITGVASDPLTAGFYLNLHQGDSMSILVNGSPALSFRPLLCANL